MSDELKEEGMGLFRRGMHEESAAVFAQAAASYHEAGDPLGEGEMYNNIGVISRVQHDWAAAHAALEQAETLFATAGDKSRQGQALGNRADLFAFQGKPEEAARHYNEAAALLAEAEEHEKRAQLLRAFSLLRLRQRRIFEALMLMKQSLEARPRLNPLQRLFNRLLAFVLNFGNRS